MIFKKKLGPEENPKPKFLDPRKNTKNPKPDLSKIEKPES